MTCPNNTDSGYGGQCLCVDCYGRNFAKRALNPDDYGDRLPWESRQDSPDCYQCVELEAQITDLENKVKTLYTAEQVKAFMMIAAVQGKEGEIIAPDISGLFDRLQKDGYGG